MIRFLDGPAQGALLMLRRAPLYLRVVANAKGEWDALDRLSDTPEPGESIHAYRIAGPARPYHIRPGGRFWQAEYRAVPDQPPAEVLNDTDRWRDWCWAMHRAEVRERFAQQRGPMTMHRAGRTARRRSAARTAVGGKLRGRIDSARSARGQHPAMSPARQPQGTSPCISTGR
ncbi:MAG: hypothetical protein U0790_00315 [Isosphaeraceae bacterium]